MLKTVGNPSTRFGDQTITSGNLVIGTSGKGIDFSANPNAPGMTSELLDDYERGTWTPTTAGDATGAIFAGSGEYTKIGNVVYYRLVISVGANFTSNKIGGLPFTAVNNASASGLFGGGVALTSSSTNAPIVVSPANGSTDLNFYSNANTNTTHALNSTNAVYRVFGFYYAT
jgi:hypothetical protein